MGKNKFKAGDRVVATSSVFGLTEGDAYTVRAEARATGCNKELRWVHLAEITNRTTDDGSFEECYFKLAAPAFKAGDSVRIASGPDNGGFGEVGDVGVVQFTCQNDCSVHFKSGNRRGESWYVAHRHLEPLAAAGSNGKVDGTLTIREGGYYRTRDGRKVGPMERINDGNFVWQSSDCYYDANGRALYLEDINDLVAEWRDEPAPAASESKFKVGDRVEIIDATERYVGTQFTIDTDEGDFDGEQAWSGRDHDSPYRWKESQLRLVAPATSGNDAIIGYSTVSTPAIVARIDNGQPLPARRPHVHASVTDASKEATRLAKANPGREFAVYEMVHTVTEQPAYDHEWMRLAVTGNKIDAIKEVRGLTGMTLKGAKDAVEHWLAVNAA